MAAAPIVLGVNLLLLVHLHDQFWWGPDDGAYAHVADRLLQGDVLSRDIKEDHPGASHLVNAAALVLFGVDLVSLRYPLIAVTFAYSALILALLWRRSLLAAAAGAITSVALGVVHYLNPQPHWYCLFFVALIALLLAHRQKAPAMVDVTVGALLGLTYLFRQLTAAFVGIGVVVWLLAMVPPSSPRGSSHLSRSALALCALALGSYVIQKDLLAVMLIGLWPLLVIALAVLRRGSCGFPWSPFIRLGGGMVVPFVPVLTYHALHGSVWAWVDDTVISALAVTDLPHLRHKILRPIAIVATLNLLRGEDLSVTVNAIYWLALLFLPLVAGALCVRTMFRKGFESVSPLALLSVFYAPVSLFNQNPIYLYYTVGLSAAALLSLPLRPRWRSCAAAALLVLSAVGVYSHAAQPQTRSFAELLQGQRTTNVACAVPRCSLYIDPADQTVYARLLTLIDKVVEPTEPIVVMPNNAEIYFLSGRPNPFHFYNTALDVRTDSDVQDAVQRIRLARPKVIVYSPEDKYVTAESEAILAAVAPLYRTPERIGRFAVYLLAGSEARSTSRTYVVQDTGRMMKPRSCSSS